jgi:hypothetical protein
MLFITLKCFSLPGPSHAITDVEHTTAVPCRGFISKLYYCRGQVYGMDGYSEQDQATRLRARGNIELSVKGFML